MGADQDVERRWLQQTARGDREAFEQLYRTYHRRIFGYLFRMLSNAEAAEEVASDVMLEMWKAAGTFRGDSQVSTWLFGIARFKGLSHLRRGRAERLAAGDPGDGNEAEKVADAHDLQDEALMKDSMKATIKQALSKLSPDHREVMELTFFQDFSYPEIAKLLDIPVNTVKTRMFHARKQLRDLLHSAGAS
jgi:RNA polymerase sigma-70 factor (ECF subfamily)